MKRNMKRVFAALIAIVMIFAIAACNSTNDGDNNEPPPTDNNTTNNNNSGGTTTTPPAGPGSGTDVDPDARPPRTPPTGEIIYGSTTRMNNLFHLQFPGGNNAVNYDIWRLTQIGMATYEWTPSEQYLKNQVVVKNETITAHPDGSKTYAFEIYDDMLFSDDTPITAANYVFSILFHNSPEFGALGASNTNSMELVGWEAYNSGNTRNFAGVRMLGEYEFSVTIAADELPFYYESYLATAYPTPMHVYAPGVTVIDSPQGASLSAEFTEDLIRQTITDENTGILYYPKVFNGPYMLTSYDPADASAVLDYNPNYKGSYDGSYPMIARIIIVETPTATRMDMLQTGAVELMPGVGGAAVNEGLDIAEAANSGIQYQNYPRAGYGKIHFRHDFGPTRFQSVRQALTYCLDRNEFARQFTHGYGIVVHGYYGASMREYRENRDELDARLNQYPFSVDRAIEVLVDDGWVLNATGGDYVEGSGLPRYKMVDGELEALVIQWFASEANPVADLISVMLVPEAIKAGIVIEKTEGDFPTLLANLYSPDSDYHMFNLATGFGNVAYLWFYYGTDDAFMGTYNDNFIRDTELERIALDMKATTPGDFDSWASKWVEFQVRWNELMVNIPLYSDLYYDFYPETLQNYYVTPMWGWAYAIQYAYFG